MNQNEDPLETFYREMRMNAVLSEEYKNHLTVIVHKIIENRWEMGKEEGRKQALKESGNPPD